MISCTEFIPSYSELFTFLEKNYGREEVDCFWEYLFKPTGEGIPLVNMVKKEGIKGCYTYWSGTLNEEAADFSMYLNEKNGWFKIVMHHCPSKGRLLELKDTIGLEPYHDYCLHCDQYRESLKKANLNYIFDACDSDKAACSIVVYDPEVFKGQLVVDKDTIVMNRTAGDNDYFHPDFHSSLNMGVHYLGEKYGIDVLKDYLETYAQNFYNREIDKIKESGLSKIEEIIKNTYKKERAEDAVKTTLSEKSLCVDVEYCPAVSHLKKTGRKLSPYLRYTTEFVMPVLAKAAGATFTMNSYDEETGKAQYTFSK